ncbi:MAG: hypothetical protein H0V14_02410, partial [Chitinophagaceae bacterium]|nr:hypothetical protein [Chitinophagaceae bacterium]
KGSHFISGIYNYCDRWCERCYFTSRCRVYENLDELKPEQLDVHNKAFWESLSKNFEDAIILLHKAAEKHGIDLNNISEEEHNKYKEQDLQTQKEIKASLPGKLTKEYSNIADTWLKNFRSTKIFEEKLIKNFELGIESEVNTKKIVAEIKDCIEIIQWYLHFIYVKFSRALSGKIEDDGWEEENGFQKDSDGSAKIALISTQRSFEAWLKLFGLMPDEEENIIPILALLQKIKTEGEKEFPNAKNFIRPGFDTISQ